MDGTDLTKKLFYSDYFFVKKAREGRYRACVDPVPGTKGAFRRCRDAASREEAERLLVELKKLLQQHAGPVNDVIELWVKGDYNIKDSQ